MEKRKRKRKRNPFRNRNDDSSSFYDRFYCFGGWPYELEFERRTLQVTIDAAGWRAGQRLLEVGCGVGVHAKVLADMGLHVTAMDASANGIAMARKQYGGLDHLTYVVADLSSWEPEHKQFDSIYARGMSYFHYELDGVNCRGVDVPGQTARLFSWLRPGGVFVLQISSDLSGDRWKTRVHSNRYRDYVDLFERFGTILSIADLNGTPIDETTRGDPSLGPTKQGVIIVVQSAGEDPAAASSG